MKYLGEVTRAVVFGSAATALIQGVFVGIGFALVGLPSPVVFGVLATIAAFLPAGASPRARSRPCSTSLFTGHWGAAIFLACWTRGGVRCSTTCCARCSPRTTPRSRRWRFSSARSAGSARVRHPRASCVGPVLLSFVVALVRFAQEGLPADA